jgi:FkbM family methyltransferase
VKALLLDCHQILKKNGLSRRVVLADYIAVRAKAALGLRGSIPVLGHSLHVLSPDMGLHLYREIVISKVYWFRCQSKRPRIIDCGSNVGMSVFYFKSLFPESRVMALEPDPESFKTLEENVQRNRLADVTLMNAAVSDKDGTVDFFMNPDNPGDLGMSVIRQGHLSKRLSVPAVRLSRLIGDEPLDFLKLDIEGAEPEVLEELNASGAIRKIDQMVIEYHHHIAGKVEGLSQILNLLVRNGFGYQLNCPDFNFHQQQSFQVVWIYAYPAERPGIIPGMVS